MLVDHAQWDNLSVVCFCLFFVSCTRSLQLTCVVSEAAKKNILCTRRPDRDPLVSLYMKQEGDDEKERQILSVRISIDYDNLKCKQLLSKFRFPFRVSCLPCDFVHRNVRWLSCVGRAKCPPHTEHGFLLQLQVSLAFRGSRETTKSKLVLVAPSPRSV